MAGYWEFPGGKLDAGESVFEALVREFDEELGIEIVAAHPWTERVVVYPHATVRLHFWRSFEWRGEPVAREAQAFRWEYIDQLTTDPWLPGALPVKRWLTLPAVYAISDAARLGVDAFLAKLDRRLADGTIHMMQLREKEAFDAPEFEKLFSEVHARCREHRARLFVNSTHPKTYWSRGDGVHMTASDLMRLKVRPDIDWCIASCHDAVELVRAGDLGFDAAVLGPVASTISHVNAQLLGWEGFRRIASTTAIPVYALGGMRPAEVPQAIANGAQGVAAIGAIWG